MRVLAILRSTLASLARSPLPYGVGCFGVLLYWAGRSLDVLALGGPSVRAQELWLGTLEGTACLACVLVAARLAGEDRTSHLRPVFEASAAGAPALWIARTLGASLIAWLAAVPVGVAGISMHNTLIYDSELYLTLSFFGITLTLELLALAAWSALAAALGGTWPGIAWGLGLLVAARWAPDSPLTGWMPLPASVRPGVLDLARAGLAGIGPIAVGAFVARRESSAA